MTRGSVRIRLTVLFACLFLASGAGLLGITYVLVSRANNSIIVARISSSSPLGNSGSALPVQVSGAPGASGPASSGTASGGTAIGGTAIGGTAAGGPGAVGTGGLPDPDLLQAQAAQTRAREDDALLLYSGIALGIMALVAAALGWCVAGRALRPLRRITSSARRISATNLNERLALDGPDDDLRELADTIDGLFARLEASLQAQRQFVANASHELRTPLARSRTLLEVALRDAEATPGSLRAACERALAAGTEQERLIEALLTLARGQRGLSNRVPLDLAALTRDVLAARGGQITASGLTVAVTLQPALLGGDEALLERAIGNLIDNALQHNALRPNPPEPDPVEPNSGTGTVWVTTGAEDGRAWLTVANTGPEIRPEAVGSLLLPFQSGSAGDAHRARPQSGPDRRLGLGLSIVAAIAAAHDARLMLTPRLTGGGLTVTLAFPAAGGLPGGPTPGQTVLYDEFDFDFHKVN